MGRGIAFFHQWGGSPHAAPHPTLLGAFGVSILAPVALDLAPPFANPGSATGTNRKLIMRLLISD